MSHKTKSLLLILASALCGAITPSITKISLEVLPPASVLYVRNFLSIIFFAILFAILHKPYSLHIFKSTWKMSLFLFLNMISMISSLNYIPSTLVPVVYATGPLLTIILQKILKQSQVITPIKIIGIIVGFGGVFFTSLGVGKGVEITLNTIIGVVIIIFGSTCFSLYTILSKNHHRYFDPLHLTYTVAILVSLVLFPFFITDTISHSYIPLLRARHVISLVGTAVVGTVLFFSIFQYSVKHSDPTTASLFTYIQPVFAVIFSILLVGETVTPLFVMGAVVTLTGAYLAARK